MNSEPGHTEPDSPHAASPTPAAPSGRRTVRVRRVPNFALLGALAGAVVAFVLTVAIPHDPDYARSKGYPEFSQLQIFGFLLLIGVVLGIAVALAVAIILDRRNDRKGQTVEADRVGVRESPDALTVVDTDAPETAPALEQNPHPTHTTNEGNA
jgi:hypothetical protein